MRAVRFLDRQSHRCGARSCLHEPEPEGIGKDCITAWSELVVSQILEVHMSYAYKLNEAVRHQPQGPQGRAATDAPMIYTIVQLMPIEADGRLRYRIKSKSENIERVVTEDQLSYSQ